MSASAVYEGYAETFRFRLAGEQNWRCCYCGVAMNRFRNVPTLCTTEHVIPKSCGGRLQWETCAAACKRCNVERSDAIRQMLVLPLRVKLCPRCGHLPRQLSPRVIRCVECRTTFSLETPAAALPFADIRFYPLIRVAGEMLVSNANAPLIAHVLMRDVLRMGFAGKLVDSLMSLVRKDVEGARLRNPDDTVAAYRDMEAALVERYALKAVNPPRGGFPRPPNVGTSVIPQSVLVSRRDRIVATGQSLFGKPEQRQARNRA